MEEIQKDAQKQRNEHKYINNNRRLIYVHCCFKCFTKCCSL